MRKFSWAVQAVIGFLTGVGVGAVCNDVGLGSMTSYVSVLAIGGCAILVIELEKRMACTGVAKRIADQLADHGIVVEMGGKALKTGSVPTFKSRPVEVKV